MNGKLVPFDESYIERVIKSPEFQHFNEELKNVISCYIDNSPYKGINLKDEILQGKNLFDREKLLLFIFGYNNPKFLPRYREYNSLIEENKKFEILKNEEIGQFLKPVEKEKWDKKIEDVLKIENPKIKLEKLYSLWMYMNARSGIIGFFTYPMGKKKPGDILSEKIEKLEKKIKDASPSSETDDFITLTMYFPGFRPYETELFIDTLDFLSSLSEETGSDLRIIQKLQKKISNPEIAEKLFIYAKKHFDGSIIWTMNEIMKYQNKKVKNLLEKVLKVHEEKREKYTPIFSDLSYIFRDEEMTENSFQNLLEKAQILLYADKYKEVKTVYYPIYTMPYRWFKITEGIKRIITEINPEVKKEDLSNFMGFDINVRSILNMDESIHDKIWEKAAKDLNSELKIE